MLKSIQKHAPDIYYKSIETWEKRKKINKYEMLLKKKYISKIRFESIDKAVLENKTLKGLSILNSDWSDVGSWDSLSKLNNDFFEKNNHIEYKSNNNSIFSKNKKVFLLGVKNLVVVTYKDKVLILKKGQGEKIKDLLKLVGRFCMSKFLLGIK